jgi:hypothetical protein
VNNVWQGALAVVREHRRAYVILNLAYYGLVLVGLAVAALYRPVQESLYEAVGMAFGEGGTFAPVTEAYIGGEVFKAIGLTFVINLLLGSFASITLPSLIVPFSGWLVAAYRAVLWGILYCPVPGVELSPSNILFGATAVILLLLEGQGYVLAMLGAYVQGQAFLFPKRAGVENWRQGYLLGLKQSARVYVLVILTLIVAALWEVLMAVVVGVSGTP